MMYYMQLTEQFGWENMFIGRLKNNIVCSDRNRLLYQTGI